MIYVINVVFILIDFFFQFHHSTLGWLRVGLRDFSYLLYTRLSQYHDQSRGFNKFARVDLDFFLLPFVFFFQIQPSTLVWLGIEKLNFVIFFYLLFISLSSLIIWIVGLTTDSGWLRFFLIYFFSKFFLWH